MKKVYFSFILVSFFLVVFFNCNTENQNQYLNIEPQKAHYVGKEACRNCHTDIYESFSKTGMGESWGLANRAKSSADFSPEKALVYDTFSNFYYKPFWENDSLYVMEFRLEGSDTIHKRIEKISYIVGSGQHTNSHIINTNGYLTQAPITYYTQKGKWDLAPGFEHGHNTRFDRKIELECISCHNAYPQFLESSLNKYAVVPLGIDCERCHGPGSLHIEEKTNGKIIDTSQTLDYTIVNPRRLSIEAQNNLCQRCHLQGITVLNDGKSFFDFMPSQKLSTTMNTFMPHYSGSGNQMIMASHVERMKMSACYNVSEKMSCITCHNPHLSVKFTPQEQYLNACKNCHTDRNRCTENFETRKAQQDNCVKCHMLKNKSIDIPHVAVTDHFIRKKPQIENTNQIAKFIEMICYNNSKPDSRTRSRAFIEFYERYEPANMFLDSAIYYLKESGVNIENGFDADLIRIYFLQSNFNKIIKISTNHKPQEIPDAWTAYRIGESFMKNKNYISAIPFLERAVELKKFALDFQNKLGLAYLQNNQLAQAQKEYQFVIQENPKNAEANAGLGYIALQNADYDLAKKYLYNAVLLDPDKTQTLINLAVTYYQLRENSFIKPLLLRAQKLEPNNAQIQGMLNDLK